MSAKAKETTAFKVKKLTSKEHRVASLEKKALEKAYKAGGGDKKIPGLLDLIFDQEPSGSLIDQKEAFKKITATQNTRDFASATLSQMVGRGYLRPVGSDYLLTQKGHETARPFVNQRTASRP